MSPEKDNKLTNKFWMIFASRYMDMTRTCMYWGFECEDGWYDLLYLACLGIREEYKKITPLYKQLYHYMSVLFIPRWNKLISKQPDWMYKTIGQGKWERKVKRFYIHMPSWPCQATQVKEKYGSLRFYTGGTYEVEKYAEIAERASDSTCEKCGEYGTLRGRGWLYTACDEHTKDEDKKSDINK